jgi:hypothetical protein
MVSYFSINQLKFCIFLSEMQLVRNQVETAQLQPDAVLMHLQVVTVWNKRLTQSPSDKYARSRLHSSDRMRFTGLLLEADCPCTRETSCVLPIPLSVDCEHLPDKFRYVLPTSVCLHTAVAEVWFVPPPTWNSPWDSRTKRETRGWGGLIRGRWTVHCTLLLSVCETHEVIKCTWEMYATF